VKHNSPFYGDSGGGLTTPNNVDISQRTADGPGDADWASKAMKVLRGSPELAGMPALRDDLMRKRLEDLLSDSNAGYDRTPQEDALLRQGQPEAPDEEQEFASLPAWAWLAATKYGLTSEKKARFMNWQVKKENGELETSKPQEPKEEGFMSRTADDKFWNDRSALEKAGRMVRPKKL
jgi:hypothetical protein